MTKCFSLLAAYPFAERHGLSSEVIFIRETKIKWDRSYNSNSRRGRMIKLLEKQGLLSKFIDQAGRSAKGLAEMRHCLRVSGEYDTFLAAGRII